MQSGSQANDKKMKSNNAQLTINSRCFPTINDGGI